MYPYLRMYKELAKFRKAPRLGFFDTHVSTHRIWPWDLDPWMELNNGRTLTLYDLGRIPMAMRMGVGQVMKANGWGMTVAGNTTRYRRRVKLFERVTMKSRMLGWDDRFLYMEQSMWRDREATSHLLLRSAVVRASQGRSGIVPPSELARAFGLAPESPPLPGWVLEWRGADAARPWPPQMA
jgi:acyl-CoA thioesterase FadM